MNRREGTKRKHEKKKHSRTKKWKAGKIVENETVFHKLN